MTREIALQLYTIREVMAKTSFEQAVRSVSEMGYTAVETAGFPGTTAQEAARLFAELGLRVTSAHVPLPLGDKKQEVLETIEALGRPAIVCTQIGPDDVKTLDTVKQLCERLNEGNLTAKSSGMEFGIHNHWWEFGALGGRLIHHIMLDLLAPDIFLEVDTYWIKVAGQNPAQIVSALGARAPMLHMKDGPATKEDPMTALGEGVMDFREIRAAAIPEAIEIVELDRCGTDILTAVKKSREFLLRP
jgi:sugar phosphate isomerase/epimerase